jgi:Na+/H+ antiporter NhaC
VRSEEKKPSSNGWALLPIVVFLVLYLGSGIYFEYIHPIKGKMGFYIMSVVVAFGIALIVAFVQNPRLSFNEKIHVCAQGIGDDNITIMLFIFLLAGAFSGIASEAGGVTSTANMLLNIIPPNFAVLVAALLGVNVFIVLGAGVVLFFVVGAGYGTLNYVTAFSAMGKGTSGMFETMIVTILVASIAALMREFGGFEAILSWIRRHFDGRRGGMFGIFFLTALMDIATANNTVAIVVAAPIAKHISEEYDVDPRKTASLLDTCSCIFQGIIPYGAQLLIAANLSGLSSARIIPYLYYPFFLMVCVIISILGDGRFSKKVSESA